MKIKKLNTGVEITYNKKGDIKTCKSVYEDTHEVFFKQLHKEDNMYEAQEIANEYAEQNKRILADMFRGFGDAFNLNFQR